MTYCLGVKVGAGLVFAADSRTNAGFDQISTFRKMAVYEQPGDRIVVLLSSGNLSIAQSVRELYPSESLAIPAADPVTLWTATSLFDTARILGQVVRRVSEQDGPALRAAGIDYGCTFILGGQVRGESPRLFLLYSTGNFIEATAETCYFQIGESKYGKPVLDRMLAPTTPLAEVAKCALVSIDATLKSNLSVGLPIDLLVYTADALQTETVVCIEENNPYFSMVRGAWGEGLRKAFDGIPDPDWKARSVPYPLRVQSPQCEPLPKVVGPPR
jgi:putative proteasome-type protease